jgi:hypothetical protein
MLRAFGLLVAIAIALLVWAVRPSESRSSIQEEPVPAPVPAPTATAAGSRWTDRPVPRLPDVSSAEETDDPEPWDGPSPEALNREHHTDLVDPPDSPEQTVEEAEPDPPEDREALHVMEEMAEGEAAPEYVPTAADEALLARATGFFDQFVSAIESNADNCDRMADALSEVLSGNRDLIAEGKAMSEDPARDKWFEHQMEATVAAGVERVMAPLQGCTSNERMLAVLSTMI